MIEIKNYLRSSFPRVFAFAKGVFNTLFVLIKWQYLAKNGKEAKYFRTCKNGELQLLKLWQGNNSVYNPLRLDIIEITELIPVILTNYNHFNPTIRINGKALQVMWRVSDYRMPMDYDVNGNPRIGHTERFEGDIDFERIITSTLPIPFQKHQDTPQNQQELQVGFVSKLPKCLEELQLTNNEIFVEDPRLHPEGVSVVTAIARFGNFRPSNNLPNPTRMIIINTDSNVSTIVHSGTDKLIEKNWVVIKHLGSEILMLKHSHPQEIVSVETTTGLAKSFTASDLIADRTQPVLNGGSAFLLIDNAYYMRVARIQIPLAKLGRTRISVIVMHDLSFREISRSKPFIFRTLGVEVCNGFAYNQSRFFFSWGQDDKCMYVASCGKDDLLDWYHKNLQY